MSAGRCQRQRWGELLTPAEKYPSARHGSGCDSLTQAAASACWCQGSSTAFRLVPSWATTRGCVIVPCQKRALSFIFLKLPGLRNFSSSDLTFRVEQWYETIGKTKASVRTARLCETNRAVVLLSISCVFSHAWGCGLADQISLGFLFVTAVAQSCASLQRSVKQLLWSAGLSCDRWAKWGLLSTCVGESTERKQNHAVHMTHD